MNHLDQATALRRTTVRRLLPLLLVGVVAGILSGLLGVGGGLLSVPAMVVLLDIPQHESHATSLAAIGPTALAGALIFGSASRVDLGVGAVLAVGAVIGVQVGAFAMRRIAAPRLRQSFGVFVLAMAVLLLVR